MSFTVTIMPMVNDGSCRRRWCARQPSAEALAQTRDRVGVASRRGWLLVYPHPQELAWSAGIACDRMLVKVPCVVAEHECVHVLGLDDGCECVAI